MTEETKIYLETTIPNVATEEAPSDRKTITQMLLGEVAKGYYTAYISALVIREINKTKSEVRKEQLFKAVHCIKHRFVEITPVIEDLADEYVQAGIIPEDYKGDATHLAAAILAGVPTVVTWNLKHLANIKTMDAVNGINIPHGYSQIRILTPYELVGHLLDESDF